MNIPGAPAPPPSAVVDPSTAVNAGDGAFQLFGDDGFTFLDFLDIINPLQHIPIVSTVYRSITGDTIDAAPRVAGGAVFGGIIGAAAGLVNVIFEETTGKDLGEHVMAFFDDDAPEEGETVLAANAPPPAAAANVDFAPAMAAWADQVLMPAPVQVQAMSPPPAARPQMADMLSYSALPRRPAQPTPPPSAMASVQASRPAIAPRIDPAVSRHSVAAVTSALREAEQEADLFAIMDFQPSMRSGGAEETDRGPDNPPGAVAPAGGWFSDAMLEALEKYEKTARLSDTSQPAATVDGS